jgi:Tfp pilus assembly PilM family ATPase
MERMSDDSSAITVGLDIGYDAVRMVALAHTPDGPSLQHIGSQPYARPCTPTTLFKQPEALVQAVQAVMAPCGDPAWPVVLGLRNRFSTIILPQIDKKMALSKSYEWLMWEAGQFLDESLDHYVIDIGLSEQETEQIRDVFLVAARRESVDMLGQVAEAAGILPAAMTVASLALINAFEKIYTLSEWETAAIAHVEPGAIDLIFIRNLQRKVVVMPIDLSSGREAEGLEMFGAQFRYLINFMPEEEAPDTIYVSAAHSGLQKLCAAWGEQLNRRVTPVGPFQKMSMTEELRETVKKVDQPAYMVATGLALQRVAG